MKCKNYTCDCDNATICPCLLYKECDDFLGIQEHIADYTKWLANEISSTENGGYYEITLPFFDINNDYIQIYAKQEGDNIVLSDDGYTLHMLEVNGFSITSNIEQIIYSIYQFGVLLEDNTLSMTARASEFPQKLNMFAQAILAINSLYRAARFYDEERQ